MADAELVAAKRGHRLRWKRTFKGVITGVPDAAGGSTPPFTVQSVADDPWSRVAPDQSRR
jgi:hypothetical protein